MALANIVKALYLTADQVSGSGGGQAVVKNELLALQEYAGGPALVRILGERSRRPEPYNNLDIPFIDDYLAALTLAVAPGMANDALIHCYSGTWSMALALIQGWDDAWGKITYTVPMHDRHASMTEHESLLGPGSYRYSHISNPEIWRVFSAGIAMADAVIVPSEASKHWLLEDKLTSEDRVCVIPHGIDAAAIPEQTVPFPNVFRLGYLGQIGPDKGLAYLIKAWGQAELGDKDGDPELWLAGRGTEALGPMVAQLAPRGRVRLFGYWPGDPCAAGGFYDQISVYCQPSVTEAFGIEILEALAHGRPVIASAGAGAAHLADHAFLPRDVDTLTGLIRHWAGRKDLTVHSENRRALARAYTWEKIRLDYLHLWRSI